MLIAAAIVVALRERQPALPMPEASVSQTPAEERVKAVGRKAELVKRVNVALVSVIVAMV